MINDEDLRRQDLEHLRRSPLFSELSEEQLAHLASRVQHREYSAGDKICREGEPGNALFIVQSGEVKIAVASPTGPEIILALLDAGDTFGELALLDGSRRCASAVTLVPTKALVIYRDDFLQLIESDPEVNRAVLASLAQMVRRTNKRVSIDAMLDVHTRIAQVLLDLAIRHGCECAEGVVFDRPVTAAELAGLAGLYPLEVQRALRAYQYDDLIRMQGGLMVLRRIDDLRRSAAQPVPRAMLD